MNIFFSSYCPIEAANFLRNPRRINKMCLESAQMLFTAIHELNLLDTKVITYTDINTKRLKKQYYINNNRVYAITHKNHPSNVWVRQSRENFLWLVDHFDALCRRFRELYGKDHASYDYIFLFDHAASLMPSTGLTKFPNCAANKSLGLDFSHVLDVSEAYKLYLAERWKTDSYFQKNDV